MKYHYSLILFHSVQNLRELQDNLCNYGQERKDGSMNFLPVKNNLTFNIHCIEELNIKTMVRPIPGIHTDTRYRYISIVIGMSKHIGIGLNM